MYAFAAYLRHKWGQQNYLPTPQEEVLEEEPSTSPYEEPKSKLVKRLAAKYAQNEPPDTIRDLSKWDEPDEEPPIPETSYVGYTGEAPVRPVDNPRPKSPYNKLRNAPGDHSLGVWISADQAQRWKDRMVLVYDRIKSELTNLPFFQELYAEMGTHRGAGGKIEPMHPVLKLFNDLINDYVNNVAGANLKDAFLFGVKYVAAFNDLRKLLPRMVSDIKQRDRVNHAIYNTQNFMWKRVKDLLNIHDIGSGEIGLPLDEMKQMRKILKQLPRGTWTYGPMQNPTMPYTPHDRPDLKYMREERKRLEGDEPPPVEDPKPFVEPKVPYGGKPLRPPTRIQGK